MGYVLIAIPEKLVPAVTRFIEEHPEADSEPAARTRAEEGFPNGWSRETVRQAYRESADNMREVLRFLAANPDREISSYEIADAIGARFGWNSVAGMLGAFGRRSANRYGLSRPMWEVRYDNRDRTLITMSSRVAEAIQSAE